ncbi:MAG: hypothetical protein DHS20C18_50110 [Saprospiraceae bacterium]|nr:MAG: hypothetical protein DHS20C18_50110 [Saprospiraceae bacterium]
MFRFLLLLLLACTGGVALEAQNDLPTDFQSRLDQAGLSFIYPADAGYKQRKNGDSPYLDSHYTIRSRKEKMEIRYHVLPYDEHDPTADLPHIKASRLLIHLASNDATKLLTGHNLSSQSLKEDYQADWGKVFYFQPKASFSTYQHCQMLALFREGKGMAYVFFLFNQPQPTIEYRMQALEFVPEEETVN